MIRCSMVVYGPRCSPWLRAVSANGAVTWVGNIGLVYPGPYVSSFGSVMAVPQVVVEVKFLLVAPSAEGLLELGFSTLEVVDNVLIEAFSVFPFELPLAL